MRTRLLALVPGVLLVGCALYAPPLPPGFYRGVAENGQVYVCRVSSQMCCRQAVFWQAQNSHPGLQNSNLDDGCGQQGVRNLKVRYLDPEPVNH
jgi:hypothetical protein